MEADHLRNSEVGILYRVVYEEKEYNAYQNIMGEWIIHNPLKEYNQKKIIPDQINGKSAFMSNMSTHMYRKSKE